VPLQKSAGRALESESSPLFAAVYLPPTRLKIAILLCFNADDEFLVAKPMYKSAMLGSSAFNA
jgi:hypothetical protein